MKFTNTTYGNNKGILKFPDHFVGEAVMIDNTSIVADANDKKIVPAGSLIAYTVQGDGTKLGEVANDATVDGVLLNDCDVTYSNREASIIIHGFIDSTKLPVTPAAAAVTALKMIQFM